MRWVLVMIVKNESKTLPRCLDSARPFVDGVVLVDTGSTDETQSVAVQWAAEAGIPCHVVSQPWKNFGVNRTQSYETARAWVDAQGWDQTDTWALLLDADQELVFDGNGTRDEALQCVCEGAADCRVLTLEQRLGDVNYVNIRLMRMDVPARCVGATHEYWDVQEHARVFTSRWWIRDHADGGARGDKFERDLRLLTDAWKECPGDPRTCFYLAQTYEGIRRLDRARAFYLRRARMQGTWEEERWMAAYRCAKIDLGTQDGSDRHLEGLGRMLMVAAQAPGRPEPLHQLLQYCKDERLYGEAWGYLERLRALPRLSTGEAPPLFYEVDLLAEWRLDLETSILAFYVPGKRAEGLAACERLLQQRETLPAAVVQTTLDNLRFYVVQPQNLPRLIEEDEARDPEAGTAAVPATPVEI